MDLDKLEAYAKHGDMGPYSAQFVELIALIRKQDAALQAATTQEVRVVASSSVPSVATVDTSEFKERVEAWAGKYHSSLRMVRDGWQEQWSKLIAHIDAHVAAQVAAKDAEIKTLTAALDAQGELTDRYQEIALSAQAAAPMAYLRFRAARQWSGVGGSDIEYAEWYETCQAHEIGDDKKPAFPVYAVPQPSPAPVAMTDEQIEKIVRDVTGDYESEYLESDRNFYRDLTRAILAAQQEAV